MLGGDPTVNLFEYADDPQSCPNQPHRAPQGPNEDIAVCYKCGMPTFSRRPEGETFGWHRDDCRLFVGHLGACQPGGSGHVMPEGNKVRG